MISQDFLEKKQKTKKKKPIRQWKINEKIDKFKSSSSTGSAFGEFASERSLVVGTSFKRIFKGHDVL